MRLYFSPKTMDMAKSWATNETHNSKLNIYVKLTIDDYKDAGLLDKVVNVLKDLPKCKSKQILIQKNDYRLDKETLKSMMDFVKNKKIDIVFEDEGEFFPVISVYRAMNKIYPLFDYIENNNFSSLEALLCAYIYVTQFPYNSGKRKEKDKVGKSAYAVLTTEKIVSTGYCNVINMIVDNLDFYNVKSFSNLIVYGRGKGDDLQSSLIVYVKDNKYNIDGYYFVDPTKSCETKFLKLSERNINLADFMIPLGDLKHLAYGFDFHEATNDHLYNYKRDIDMEVDDAVAINSFSVDKFKFNKQFQDYLNNNFKMIDELNKRYNELSTGEKELSSYIQEHPEIVQELLEKNSEPIRVETFINAMRKIYQSFKTYDSDEQMKSSIVNTIFRSIESSEVMFNEGAKNSFFALKDVIKLKE